MDSHDLPGNCKVRLLYNLGTVHHWDAETYPDLESFKNILDKRIKADYNSMSTYIETLQKYYIAISHSPSQPNETQWLKELGFKQLEMGDGLVLSSMDYFTWQQLR